MFDFNLLPFFVSMLFLTLIVLAIGIHFWRNVLVMFVVIPIAMFCAFTGYNTIVNILGYPVLQDIPKNSMYISHMESVTGEEIYVWALEPNRSTPKNFRIAGSAKNKKTMQQAREQSRKGIAQQIGKYESLRESENNSGDYVTYDFTIDGKGFKE